MKYSHAIKNEVMIRFIKNGSLDSISHDLSVPMATVKRWVKDCKPENKSQNYAMGISDKKRRPIYSGLNSATLEYKTSPESLQKIVEPKITNMAYMDAIEALNKAFKECSSGIIELKNTIKILSDSISRLDSIKINKPFAKIL